MQLFHFLFVLLGPFMIVQSAAGQKRNVSTTAEAQSVPATGQEDDVTPQSFGGFISGLLDFIGVPRAPGMKEGKHYWQY
ncbi:unnamed protein product [Cylicocyclus nassatus]|uniref:Uncharacterized protein n=1 Tax=Cylicocyclus nassatus TaxID=53992 RepID=A0AA36M774_CYLNA|nr:unnamed protein product [Cylicocyclus nassatus]